MDVGLTTLNGGGLSPRINMCKCFSALRRKHIHMEDPCKAKVGDGNMICF